MKRFKYTTLLLILCFALPVLAQQQGDNTTPEFEASYKAAVEYYWSSNKTPEEAIDLFTALIDENPDFPEAYAYRASVYRVEQDFELAQIDLNMALELEPDNALVNSVQARLFFDMGDEDTAQDLAAEFADRDDLVADTY
ncbi:MAG: tetratricopeptide repeat protein, partial [Aggregatilineales bacterium]